MVATFTQNLKRRYKNLTFKTGPRFSFRPPKTFILGPEDTPNFELLSLHELGHALSNKYDYQTDIERLKIERLAWENAKNLCSEFGVSYDEEFVETELDSYRDWLHTKSKCPKCHLTRYQTPDGHYHCPHCDDL